MIEALKIIGYIMIVGVVSFHIYNIIDGQIRDVRHGPIPDLKDWILFVAAILFLMLGLAALTIIFFFLNL